MATIATAHQTGLKHVDISARSLRTGGAIALMCCSNNHTTIHMLGRLSINVMLQYLHLQAKPLMHQFTVTIFNHGTYSSLPTDTVPSGDY
jgi:hypothetical protein